MTTTEAELNSHELVDALLNAIGPAHVLTSEHLAVSSHRVSVSVSTPIAVVRPADTQETAMVVGICNRFNCPFIAIGGNTGLVGGTEHSGAYVAISTERLNQIDELDAANKTITVGAGVKLQQVQEAASDKQLVYAMDIGARGSATIGGNISTNAGGNRVIRYGMTRQLVLGVEVVLPNGKVINHLQKALKDNAGFDLKQLFIGSEGTLGIVTKATLRLHSAHSANHTALLATSDFSSVTNILNTLDHEFSGMLSAFEVMWDSYFEHASSNQSAPFTKSHNYYILIEAQGNKKLLSNDFFEEILAELVSAELIDDAVICKSETQREALWAIRDNIESLNILNPVWYYDVSLSIGDIEHYLSKIETELGQRWPDYTMAVFGHLGDGNIHLIASPGVEHAQEKAEFDDVIYRHLAPFNGSISAEHGIGIEKRAFLHYSQDDISIDLMRLLKQTLDPRGLLNPGKVI